MAEPVASDVTCTACGCLCDDLVVHADRAIEYACSHGTAWIDSVSKCQPPAPALVGNQPSELDAAIAAAAKILTSARFPLVFGLAELCVDGQRAAVALADQLGACLDIEVEEDPTIYFP